MAIPTRGQRKPCGAERRLYWLRTSGPSVAVGRLVSDTGGPLRGIRLGALLPFREASGAGQALTHLVAADALVQEPGPALDESYPSLTLDDVSAAIGYGAELARERLLDLRASGE